MHHETIDETGPARFTSLHKSRSEASSSHNVRLSPTQTLRVERTLATFLQDRRPLSLVYHRTAATDAHLAQLNESWSRSTMRNLSCKRSGSKRGWVPPSESLLSSLSFRCEYMYSSRSCTATDR